MRRSRLRQTNPQVRLPKLYYVPFSIEDKYYPNMLKWTHSNAVMLEKIGTTPLSRSPKRSSRTISRSSKKISILQLR